MKRKHKNYTKPKRPFDKRRIDEEAKVKRKYGLKNKKEIWKAEARIHEIREKAKNMINSEQREKEKFFDKLKKIGLNVESIGDVLSLNKNDYLDRRLQTIVAKDNAVPTSKTARQMIVHKKVLVDGRAINKPSYIVPVELEKKIKLKFKPIKNKPVPGKDTKKDSEKVEEKKPDTDKKDEGKDKDSENKGSESKEKSTDKKEENSEKDKGEGKKESDEKKEEKDSEKSDNKKEESEKDKKEEKKPDTDKKDKEDNSKGDKK